MSLTFIPTFICMNIFFLLTDYQYSLIWIYHSLFIHLPVYGPLDCFHLGDCYNYCYYKHLCKGLCVDLSFNYHGAILRMRFLGHMVYMLKYMFKDLRYYDIVYQSGYTIFAYPPAMFESSSCSILSSTLGLISYFNFSHSNVV